METPSSISKRTSARKHAPTPKMSDRKKSLFTARQVRSQAVSDDNDSDLGIISPLQNSSDSDSDSAPRNRVSKDLFSKKFSNNDRYEFLNRLTEEDEDKEYDIRRLPTNSFTSISKAHDLSAPIILLTPCNTLSSEKAEPPKLSLHKPGVQSDSKTPNAIPESPNPTESSKVRTSLSFTEGFIPTRSFYGASAVPKTTQISVLKEIYQNPTFQKKASRIERGSSKFRGQQKKSLLNRGVFHKIRKVKTKQKKAPTREKVSSVLHAEIENNENGISAEHRERLIGILQSARPRASQPAESQADDEDSEVEEEPRKPGKFFKSRSGSKARFCLENSVSIVVKRAKKRDVPKKRPLEADVEVDPEFEVVQAEVSGLLDKLSPTKSSPTSKKIRKLTSDIEAMVLPESASQKTGPSSLFSVFLKGNARKGDVDVVPPAKRHKSESLGFGANQLQIDAGQKEFGATECKQCGFTYTQHVPEDEKQHKEFHESSRGLEFKGWEREKVVMEVSEWGVRGRIIAVSMKDPKFMVVKAAEVLKLADLELGFAPIPTNEGSIAYLACNHKEVLGICVAQPLKEANKLFSELGIDFCSEETFPVKCGISRIWVSTKHRRTGVATHLIRAVRNHFSFGGCLRVDQLAFSAPTEMGKLFAQKICSRPDFYVFQ